MSPNRRIASFALGAAAVASGSPLTALDRLAKGRNNE